MSTPLLMSWSGGKDCALALERLVCDPRWRVIGLMTTVTAETDRVAIHGVRRSVVHAQAVRLRLPLFEAHIPAQASNEQYEAAFANALAQVRAQTPAVDTVAFGDIHLAEIRAYREAQLARLGWRAQFPLWGEDTRSLAQHALASGLRAVVCCVDTQQLDAAFCAREFDAQFLGELPGSCDPCGENGEFHTCVYASALWPEPLALIRGERVLRDARFVHVDLRVD